MKILGVLLNLVPYHVARWSATAAMPDTKVVIAQLRKEDEFRVLESKDQGYPFELETLGMDHERSDPAALRKVAEILIDRHRPDVVVISGYSFPVSLAFLEAALKRKLAVVVCSESNREDFVRSRMAEWVKGRVVRLCGAGLAGGGPQKSYLMDLGLPANRVFTGYNAVDNGHFERGAARARESAEATRGAFGLPARYFFAVARFTAKKNLTGLITAYGGYLSKAGSEAPDLVIAGDGPLRTDLEDQILDRGLKERVHLVGAIAYDLLPTYYGLATAFVHASSTEQWGLVVNEAMAAGLPVLVSRRCGCAADLVKDGVTGRQFDPGSAEEIAGALEWAAGLGPVGLETCGQAAKQRVREWSPEAFAAGMHSACKVAQGNLRRLGWIDTRMLHLLMRRAGE